MAWVEDRGGRYRVRYRRFGRLVTDNTYTSRDDATEHVARLNMATRAARQRYQTLPGPRLEGWVAAWLPVNLTAD